MNEDLRNYFSGDELAANVWKSKYAMENEKTPDDMHRRLAREFAKYSDLPEEEIYELFKDFKYIIPQGSVMFGAGRGLPISLSNCVVLDNPMDSYRGIMYTDAQLTDVFKRRMGAGINLSSLRPEGVPVDNSAKTTTGAHSFMDRFSNTTREVGQSGRRGALMEIMDIRHPDIEKFVTKKQDLSKVTGANVSVFLRKDFMQAVEENKDYLLRFPCDVEFAGDTYEEFPYNELVPEGEMYVKRVKAKELWDTIISCAHATAEPGLLFLDNVHEFGPDGCYEQYKAHATNPCAEIPMSTDSCRLICTNLFSFVKNPFTENAEIDKDTMVEIFKKQMVLSDALVDMEIDYINRIIEKINTDPEPDYIKEAEVHTWQRLKEMGQKGRRTGAGITGLGDMLAALGIKYDSQRAMDIVHLIFQLKFIAELETSIELAAEKGAFDGFDITKEGKHPWGKWVQERYPDLWAKMKRHGRRNVSFSTIAPTGSVSLLTQTTSGIEPLFAPYYMRRKKINPDDKGVRVDYVDDNGDSWQEFPVFHPKFKAWILTQYDEPLTVKELDNFTKGELDERFKRSPWYGSTANDIDWLKRVEMQQTIGMYITHAISSTINLPNDVSVEEVAKIYEHAHKLGLKGVTVYRDGCRSGVLVSEGSKSPQNFEQNNAPKRPEKLEADVSVIVTGKAEYSVYVGLLDGKPYEVFAHKGIHSLGGYEKDSEIVIVKKGKGEYVCVVDGGEENKITQNMNNPEEATTRMISTALRHGASIEFIVDQLNKTSGAIGSFSQAIARVLKKFIPDGTKSTDTCVECGEKGLVYEEGCVVCKFCGFSGCN